MTTRFVAILALALTTGVTARADEFPREGTKKQRARKDPLEGKAPPQLAVNGWRNTDGKSLELTALKGKVVLLDFWGFW